jgi:hypothetical protein
MNEYSIALAVSFSAVLYFSITFFVRNAKKNKAQEGMNITQSCSAMERRRTFRNNLDCKAIVQKIFPEGNRKFEEFEIRDISSGGLYLYTDSSVDFNLGDEIDLMVQLGKSRYYNGKGRVVHSQAIFNDQSIIMESGIGIRFLSQPNSVAALK